jgi:hypothetical protein
MHGWFGNDQVIEMGGDRAITRWVK